ncbi:protoporphyrinogen/coproporphyrinogen oxidase [Citricoccus nitrophenolicus]|uniref:protoporphyrinogen/coproporphyrinogen oxidase n=1 Tax=Citricoccus nitrophenolicus TaxID=863575 RepID=UPI0039B67819
MTATEAPAVRSGADRAVGPAVVVGGGISGLLAAWELARAGHRTTLVEATDSLGGCVAPRHLGLPAGESVTLDAGAESFAVRIPAVRELIDELGLGPAVVEPNPAGSWLYLPPAEPGIPHRAVPSPRLGLVGIPGDLEAPEVAEALGPAALARARQDLDSARSVERWQRILHGAGPVTVGELVRDRMGDGVLERLVAPVVAGVHSADPDTVDLRTVAPGLLEALVEHGSLSRAVAARRGVAPPGAAVASLHGGMNTLTAALAEELGRLGVRTLTNTRAVSLERGVPGRGAATRGWTVTLAGSAAQTVTAERVVVATDGPRAWDLLAPVSRDALAATDRPPEGAGVALVTLVAEAPGLDGNPRGTGLLVSPSVPGEVVGAKALTHISAKWDWVPRALGAGSGGSRHALRLSYGRVSDAPDSTAPGFRTPDADLLRMAVEDAAALTGVDRSELADGLLDASVVRWRSALPAATPAHRARVGAARAWLEDEPGLDAVGAWVSGTGLAAIVADVRRRIGGTPDAQEG